MAGGHDRGTPFLFDRDFGEALPEERSEEPVAPPPPAPTFSLDELEAARQQGLQIGREAALAESAEAVERAIAAVLSRLESRLGEMETVQRHTNAEIARQTTELAVAVVGKMLPHYAREHGLTEIEGVVRECLSVAEREAEVIVKVAPALVERADERLAPVAAAAGIGDRLRVVADAALGPADCKVDWRTGGAERSEAQVWAEVEAALARTLPHISGAEPSEGTSGLQPAGSAGAPAAPQAADRPAAGSLQSEDVPETDDAQPRDRSAPVPSRGIALPGAVG